MPWIESHTTLARHPKTLKLARALDVSKCHAIGLIHCLWWWCLEYEPDGNLSRHDPALIAEACDWKHDPKRLVEALEQSGFVTNGEVHDWYEYAGKYINRKSLNRERMRNARAAHVQRTCNAHAEHVREMCGATIPNHTIPYQPYLDTCTPRIEGVVRGSEVAKAVETDGSKEPKSAVETEKKALTVAQKPPTRDEMDLHAAKIGLPAFEVEKFVNHYASKGWKVGKEPMKSWHAAMAGWKCRWQERNGAHLQPDHSKGF